MSAHPGDTEIIYPSVLPSFIMSQSLISKAIFTLHGSSDPIPVFSSRVAQIGSGPGPCKQEKIAWIPIFFDRFQVLFVCGNKSDMNWIPAFAPAV